MLGRLFLDGSCHVIMTGRVRHVEPSKAVHRACHRVILGVRRQLKGRCRPRTCPVGRSLRSPATSTMASSSLSNECGQETSVWPLGDEHVVNHRITVDPDEANPRVGLPPADRTHSYAA